MKPKYRSWEIEEPKSLTVLLLCFKTNENLRFRFWEIEEPKSLTVWLLCLKICENLILFEDRRAKKLDCIAFVFQNI